MELPECEVFEEDLVLSYKENIELITKLVEEGPSAIDRFVSEQQKKDSTISKYIKSLRKRLERQAAKIREERRSGYMQKLKALQRKRETQVKEVQKEAITLTEEQQALQDRLNEILKNASSWREKLIQRLEAAA